MWPFLVAFVSQKRLPVVLVAIIIGSIAFRGYAFFNMGESWFTLYLNTFSRIDALALGGLALGHTLINHSLCVCLPAFDY